MTGSLFKVRKAIESDLSAVVAILKKAIRNMIDNGIYQWDEIYPTEKDIESDIEDDSLYLCIDDDKIVAFFALNRYQDPEYSEGHWQYEEVPYSVVHRLCVDPDFQGKGIGAQAMFVIENIIKNDGKEAVRLDAFSKNPAALRLYEKLGYSKVGEIRFRKGLFFLFEKKL